MNNFADKILNEIRETIGSKMWNVKRGTASEREKQIIQECLGFECLIKHSCLSIIEIKRLWDESGLKYQ